MHTDIIVFIAEEFSYMLGVVFFIALFFHRDAYTSDTRPNAALRRWLKELLFSLIVLGMVMGITVFLKETIAAPRPFVYGDAPLFYYGGYDSFPSGHASFFAALTVLFFTFHRSLAWVLLVITIFISGARVIGGVHYLHDILAGLVLGGGGAYLALRFLTRLRVRLSTMVDFFFKNL